MQSSKAWQRAIKRFCSTPKFRVFFSEVGLPVAVLLNLLAWFVF